VAGAYLGTGLLIAIVAGWTMAAPPGAARRAVVYEVQGGGVPFEGERLTWADRVARGRDAIGEIVGRVWPYVLAGIAVGRASTATCRRAAGLLHGEGAWWPVPLAVVMGIPMYSNAAGIIYFATQVAPQVARNWNGQVRVLERNWHAFSWRVETPGLSLAQMVSRHLEG